MKGKNFFSGLEYMVLLAILALKNNAYGVPVHEEICEQTGKDVAYGAVYKALKSLEAKGYVKSYKGKSTPERGGKRKHGRCNKSSNNNGGW